MRIGSGSRPVGAVLRVVALSLLAAGSGSAQGTADPLVLWYPAPARQWVEALPVP